MTAASCKRIVPSGSAVSVIKTAGRPASPQARQKERLTPNPKEDEDMGVQQAGSISQA